MLQQLLFFFFFETAQPSHATFLAFLPEVIQIEVAAPGLSEAKSPIKKGESLEPIVGAKSVFSIDAESGTPLLTRDIFVRRPIASIAKLITAMVILDYHAMDEKVTVGLNAANQEPTKMNLKRGEEISVESLLTGLLVGSANDAAVALAEFDAGSEAAFVEKMNAKAEELNLQNSHFSNPKGFDEDKNYSTAFDTMLFGRAALGYPFIRTTVSLKTADVTSLDGKIKHHVESTNELLDDPNFLITGLKTGHTPAAGQSFVSLMKGPNNHEILTVMLDSPDRFKETKIVLDWILRNFEFPAS